MPCARSDRNGSQLGSQERTRPNKCGSSAFKNAIRLQDTAGDLKRLGALEGTRAIQFSRRLHLRKTGRL